MGTSITGIPTTRVTAMFTRDQLLRQTQYNQFALSILEEQLSSGYRFQTPSEDPIAAMQTISLQRLIQRKDQVKTNLETTQSYLNATDTSLKTVSDLLIDARATALGVMGTTYNDTQRQTAAQQIQQTIQQMLNIGNQQFRGRYLFSGSESLNAPFMENSSGMIEYLGNDQHLMSYSDLNLLTSTNVTGNEAFGAISAEVKSTEPIIPVLTYDTPLANLRQGQGISKGSIAVSDGTRNFDGTLNEVTIDLSNARTIGDVAALIAANPPSGRELYVEIVNEKVGTAITNTIKIQLNPSPTGGNLTIREVGSGTVAEELGIRNDTGSGMAPIVGRPLEPTLRNTTLLDDMFGHAATAVVHSQGTDNDIILTGDTLGASLNNIPVLFISDPMINSGGEFVEPYNPMVPEVRVHVAGDGTSRADQVISAINTAHDLAGLPFTARIDPLDNIHGGLGYVAGGVSTDTGTTGYGELMDKSHGLQIVNNGKEQSIDFSLANTLGDVLNILNGSGTGVLAQINESNNGINLRSSVSGCDFEVGENGGKTAFQFGIRSMNDETTLSKLNYGFGVQVAQNSMVIEAKATYTAIAANANIQLAATGTAADPGGDNWNNFAIVLQDTGANPPTVAYNTAQRTITVGIQAGTTTANDVIQAVNTSAAYTDFTASIARNADGTVSDGTGKVNAGRAVTNGGTPIGNDFTITRSDGVNLYVDLSSIAVTSVENLTIQNVIDSINNDPRNIAYPTPTNPTAGKVVAHLDKYGNGIELVDNSQGSGTLVVTKNTFSHAAIDLGLVPSGQTTSNPIVRDNSTTLRNPANPLQSGIRITGANPTSSIEGVQVEFVPSATATEVTATYSENMRLLTVVYDPGATASEVVTAINASSAAVLFEAELATNDNTGAGQIADLTTVGMSGGSSTRNSQTPAAFPGDNNNLIFTADEPGYAYEGMTVQFLGIVGAPGMPIEFDHDVVGNQVIVRYDASAPGTIPTANDIVAAWGEAWRWTPPGDTTYQNVSVSLDATDGTVNAGTGLVAPDIETITAMTTGVQVLSGEDVNPQETQGIFTALIRIRDALIANDQIELERAFGILDAANTNLNYTRADLGAREQGLELTQEHLASENIDLQTALSDNHDVDFVQVVSDLTARQTAYQASLMSLGKIMQISLLNYL
jgi:flagellar hook-associated protein 3